jgi:hypothetical protein
MKKIFLFFIISYTMLFGSNTILFAKFKSQKDALSTIKIFNKILKKRKKNYKAHITLKEGYYCVVSDSVSSAKERRIIANDIENYFDGVNDPVLTANNNHIFRFVLGFGYDDNIYSHTTFEITDYGEIEFDNNTSQVSDNFHREILSYFHTYHFENDKWDWNSYVNLYNRGYQDHDNVNIFQLALHTGPKYFFTHGDISLLFLGEKLWYGGDAYMNSYGLSTKLTYKSTDKSRSDIALVLMEKRYEEKQRKAWDSNHLSLKMGTTFYASENYALRIESGGAMERKVNGGRTDVSYNTLFMSAKYMMPLWEDAHLSLKLGVESRDYQDKNPNLPKREDRKWRFKSEISQKLTDTLTVLLNYKYTDNDSNINSYTYKNNTVILNLLSTY